MGCQIFWRLIFGRRGRSKSPALAPKAAQKGRSGRLSWPMIRAMPNKRPPRPMPPPRPNGPNARFSNFPCFVSRFYVKMIDSIRARAGRKSQPFGDVFSSQRPIARKIGVFDAHGLAKRAERRPNLMVLAVFLQNQNFSSECHFFGWLNGTKLRYVFCKATF